MMIRFLLPILLLGALGCDKGDWFPPERTAREVLNGWDMWDTAAVMPYRMPMVAVPAGSLPIDHQDNFAAGQAELHQLSAQQRRDRGALAYRRYCHHCHGPNGDSRIIVGESFAPAVPDLRSNRAQALDDRAIYNQLMRGSQNMIPLDDTLTPLEAMLTIAHMRTLAGAGSRPFFPPASTKPAR
jgi:mono/diheme cytochrome c family protein